jgi:excisionase family DNA binding protein
MKGREMPYDLKSMREKALACAEKSVPEKPLLTIDEAAEAVGRSTRWVRFQLANGKIPFVRHVGKRAIYRDVIVEILAGSDAGSS